MDLLSNLNLGFSLALTWQNILFCFMGALLGTILGVLPGIGPVAGISLLLPITYTLNPTSAVIMFAGIYYGAAYGGSTTSILVNTPGEGMSVITCLDGYAMARQGRAKAALATSAIGSFFAGTLSTIATTLIAIPIAEFALRFAPPEFFALMLMAMTAVGALTAEAPTKGLFSTLIGLFLAMVGMDQQTGQVRFAFGVADLIEGVDFVVLAIGLFAVAEVLVQAEAISQTGIQEREHVKGKLWISWKELKESFGPYCRGTLVGYAMGALPGVGPTTSSFLSYALEKKVSKHPEQFGKGAIEGVAGPESANNAAATGAMVHLLVLGIPGSATTAIMLGAFIMYGLQPGPLLFTKNPDFVWAIIASMYIGNVILLILNLPLVNVFAKILDLPAAILYAMVLAFCCMGVYVVRFAVLDIFLVTGFGIMGFFMKKHGYPGAPLLLAFILGDLAEQALRRSLALSNGDWTVFFTRPISLTILIIVAIFMAIPLMNYLRRKAKQKGGENAPILS
jgi:putative tricarboxylic transport membrane protein